MDESKREPLQSLRRFRRGFQVPAWSQELSSSLVYFGVYLVASPGVKGQRHLLRTNAEDHAVGHEEDDSAPETVTVGQVIASISFVFDTILYVTLCAPCIRRCW